MWLLGLPGLRHRASASGQGFADKDRLVIAADGVSHAPIVVRDGAGPWEQRAADDLAKYIELMTGGAPQRLTNAPDGIPAIIVGQAAVQSQAEIGAKLRAAAKPDPVVQADAILVQRRGDRIYVAGSNDESHYFAAAWLLQRWGCRWYMPTPFGEHVPRHKSLSVAALDHVYAPPFEVRHYWLSWNGDKSGAEEFRRRNFMSAATIPGAGQVLDQYTADLAPAGKRHFNVPFSAPATAAHVASRIEADYAAGKDISLAIADGVYSNDDPGDRALISEYDRYFLRPSLSDAMLTLYNNVAQILKARYPKSPSRIGGQAYVNVTLPPRQVRSAADNLVMWIAPIDIDPNHAMNDPVSPPRQEYREMVKGWAAVMDGRLAIYDYDQSMLVWRDLPNPSHHVFARDVKIYRDIGILGFGTESRGAFATIFLNLFFRGQLMWNPDADVNAMLEQFYEDFYGPASAPMRSYWSKIFGAWEKTAVTEHEYFIIPAIYTPALVRSLRRDVEQAEQIMNRRAAAGRKLLDERIRFTRRSFEVMENYVQMVTSAASQADYADAVVAGERAIAARLALAQMNPTFTIGVLGAEPEDAESAAWLSGEVKQMRDLAALTDGTKGSLLAKLPLSWAFRRSTPLPENWKYEGMEGSKGSWDTGNATQEPSPNKGWETARTDLYLQAQGILAPGGQAALGHYWYQVGVELPIRSAGPVHLMFPGLFNEAWLYVNGSFVAHRPYTEPWWLTDYRFEWDVDVTKHLRLGRNVIALRGFNPHHMGGIFRRPFLYRSV